MNLEQKLKKWWEENGELTQEKAESLYIKQQKPLGHIPRTVFRPLIKKFRCKVLPVNKKDPRTPIKNQEEFLKILEKGITSENICKQYVISEEEFKKSIVSLQFSGYNIVYIGDMVKLEKNIIQVQSVYKPEWKNDTVIKFGVVSDNHLCSKWQQLTFLNYLYDVFEHEGVDTVYNAGDITDGYYKNRPAHIYELIDGKIGADQQSDYVINVYPKRKNITTRIIDGNHDGTHIINGGTNICKKIARERSDIEYLGSSSALVYLTPKCTMKLIHPIDGTAYALSYSLQKMIDAISGGEKPNILISGHHHKSMYMFYRNIHAIEAGTTCAQTPWMEGKKIAAHVSGWLITVHVDKDGTITRFVPELIPQYHAIQNDF